MIKRVLSLGAVLAVLAGPAFAAHCPLDVMKIDEALAGDHGLDAAQVANVQSLRDKGEALHSSGDHAGAIENLHQALEILGIPE